MINMFLQATLTFPEQDLFGELLQSAHFEPIAKGRLGAILVDQRDDQVPIVRTTTVYQQRASRFLPIHYRIVDQIKQRFSDLDLHFNNALIEVYDNNYRTMGPHSDQELDLTNDSYICVFSCYDRPSNVARTLVVQNKTSQEARNISLSNYSVVLFSTAANREHLHKIILESNSNNRWLGVTFRLSKTYIRFVDERPYFVASNRQLLLANAEQRKEFYKHRGLENKSIGYNYPELIYTISPSDTLPPI